MVSPDRIARWVEAGLITGQQAEAIAAFEHGRTKPTTLYAVGGLAGLAIAVGLVSIVAANWDAIPGRAKIGIDLLLVAGVGFAVAWWDRRGPSWAREVAILVLYGLVIASIALIGQVYQLGGEAHEALAIWTVLTAILMTRARSGFAAAVWILGIQITWSTWAVWFAERFHDWESLALASVYWAPLLCVALAQSRGLQRRRPGLAAALEAIGWTELLLCATLGTFAFYESTIDENWSGLVLGGLASAALTGWIALKLPEVPGRNPQRALLVVCLVLAHVPLLVSPGDLDLVAALAFAGLWATVAVTAHRTHNARLLNLATAMLGIRIVVVYFEVFGTLLDTGVGLVTGGLLTLGLMWLWVRKRRDFARDLSAEQETMS